MFKLKNNATKCLFVDSCDSDSVGLKPVEGEYEKPLCFARGNVFVADAELIRQMQETFASGNIDDLESLWRKAEPWAPESSQ